MLKWRALWVFTGKPTECQPYEEGLEPLRTRYICNDDDGRLLMKWKSIRRRTSMQEEPEEVHVAFSRSFVASVMSIHYQLHPEYYTDGKLLDRFLNVVDIQNIEDAVSDHSPRMDSNWINRVANCFSSRRKTP